MAYAPEQIAEWTNPATSDQVRMLAHCIIDLLDRAEAPVIYDNESALRVFEFKLGATDVEVGFFPDAGTRAAGLTGMTVTRNEAVFGKNLVICSQRLYGAHTEGTQPGFKREVSVHLTDGLLTKGRNLAGVHAFDGRSLLAAQQIEERLGNKTLTQHEYNRAIMVLGSYLTPTE